MQSLIRHLENQGSLSNAQIREATAFLLDSEPEASLKADFLRALARKGETPEEIAGFVTEFLGHAVLPDLDPASLPGPMLDVVGTGGDKLHLFNISSTAMFILAAGGVCVVKHGNRGITSKTGGADVLEALGIKIALPPDQLVRCVREVGLGFVFAPHYHPAFKAVVDVRKILAAEGQRSIFNIIGPLLNPAKPPYQLIGVFDEALVPVFASILKQLGRKGAWVVHGKTADGRGMDEFSTLGLNKVAQLRDGEIEYGEIDPAEHGFPSPALEELAGGEAVENADILEGILAGRIKGGKRDIAVLNAAAGFTITGITPTLGEGKALAEDLLSRGAAHHTLKALQDWV